MGARVHIEAVSKGFTSPDGVSPTIIRDVSFIVDGGDIMRLAGPSGSGKSTLLNILSGLMLPDSGSVTVGDARLETLSEVERDRFRAKHIGYIFQTFNLIAPLTVLENVLVPMRLAGRGDADLKSEAIELFEQFGLSEQIPKHPWQLSVGQRQRVAAVRAILSRPHLLLADEPTASLDPDSASAIISAIRQLNEDGATVILATHDPALAELAEDSVYDLAVSEAHP